MPRNCNVCSHPKRESIEFDLAIGAPYRVLACRYRVSKSALERHARLHSHPIAAKLPPGYTVYSAAGTTQKNPCVRLDRHGRITFNRAAARHFAKCKRVRLLINRSARKIAFQPVTAGEGVTLHEARNRTGPVAYSAGFCEHLGAHSQKSVVVQLAWNASGGILEGKLP